MTESKTKPYAPRVVSEGDIPVHRTLGEAAQTRNVGVPRPMPGIIILIHGVNDVGEAYQNQEKGILAGLGKRLNRQDFLSRQIVRGCRRALFFQVSGRRAGDQSRITQTPGEERRVL